MTAAEALAALAACSEALGLAPDADGNALRAALSETIDVANLASEPRQPTTPAELRALLNQEWR